jgi:hypothetical protein
MGKKEKITVQGTEITIVSKKNADYICLTDMVKGQEGEDHIRNRNTLEFLGAWEMLHNPTFKGVEFDTFLHEAGANRFNMTLRKWIEATDAVGVISKAGRNGGTYAHKDIAFEFGSWLSPVFKLYLITACLHEMAEWQLARLNAIDAEKGFRKLETKNIVVKKR